MRARPEESLAEGAGGGEGGEVGRTDLGDTRPRPFGLGARRREVGTLLDGLPDQRLDRIRHLGRRHL